MGHIRDGIYEGARDAVRFFSTLDWGQLERLRSIFEETAAQAEPSVDEVVRKVEAEVPEAAEGVRALLAQGGTPLATWVLLILTALLLVQGCLKEEAAPPTAPQKIEQIVELTVVDVERRQGTVASQRP